MMMVLPHTKVTHNTRNHGQQQLLYPYRCVVTCCVVKKRVKTHTAVSLKKRERVCVDGCVMHKLLLCHQCFIDTGHTVHSTCSATGGHRTNAPRRHDGKDVYLGACNTQK